MATRQQLTVSITNSIDVLARQVGEAGNFNNQLLSAQAALALSETLVKLGLTTYMDEQQG